MPMTVERYETVSIPWTIRPPTPISAAYRSSTWMGLVSPVNSTKRATSSDRTTYSRAALSPTFHRSKLRDGSMWVPAVVLDPVELGYQRQSYSRWLEPLDIVGEMPRLSQKLRSALKRLEHEAAVWREEPLKRVAVRNKLFRPLRVRQFQAFGAHSLIDRPYWLYGTRQISIGERVVILRGAWIAVERMAWDKPAPVLIIGDGVGIRTGFTVSAAASVVIEDDVGMGADCTVIDSRHTWSSGHPNPIFNPVESDPVRIGRGTWLADRVTVSAGSEIGEHCAIGANSTVSGKVPDFSVVLGNPGRVVGSTRT